MRVIFSRIELKGPLKRTIVLLIPSIFLICHATAFLDAEAANQATTSGWQLQKLPFRVLNTTGIKTSLWICGTNETVAVSSDAGEHWQVKHEVTDGAVLLNIGFANEQFGYAAGTGGRFLTTEDGGETWSPHSAGKDAILQVSFSDTKRGLIRTFASLLFSVDGGVNWSVVSVGQNTEEVKRFPYSFSLVALDSAHMAVMMKQGSAQYEPQGFLITGDTGKSWKFVDIPSVTLYSFLSLQGKYWTVGTEVVDKDKPGGGHSVPVALYSSDGEKWDHSSADLSSCKPEMCIACTTAGCLSANGTVSQFFTGKASYKEFSPTRDLTPKWAAAGIGMCFVGRSLQCASLTPVDKPTSRENPIPLPTAVGPGPISAPSGEPPRCIICSMDRILIDQKVQGAYTVKLVLEIGQNGVVRTAVAEAAPTPEVKSRIEEQAEQWIFEPYLKDGVAVNVKLNTSVRVNVIKPR